MESVPNLNDEILSPEVLEKDTVQGDVVFEQEDPNSIFEIESELTELAQVNPEKAVEVLSNNPEKETRLRANIGKAKAIANILGDAAAIGIGAGVMMSNTDSHEHLVFNATNITVIIATVLSVFKLAWDLAGQSNPETKTAKTKLA